jgi:hypothetical protein
MPQFQPDEVKVAKAVMHNPTARAFDYRGVLYMGVDQVAMAEVNFSLNAGESQEVSFSVTMPSQAGVYPIYLSVFSGGELLSHYQATENVSIAAPYPFNMTITQIETATNKYANAYWLMQPNILVSNPHSVPVSHKLYCGWAFGSRDPNLLSSYAFTRCWGGGAPGTPANELYELYVTLNPGQSVTLVSPFYYTDGLWGWERANPYEWSNLPDGMYSAGVRKKYYFRIIDELGNWSPVMSVGTA